MSSEARRVLAVMGFAALLCGSLRAETPPPPPLGNAASFAVLGGSAVNNSGATVVTGNLGVSPGNTITGFSDGAVKLGDTFKNDALAKAAHNDAGIAYEDLAGQKCSEGLQSGPLGGSPVANVVHCFSSPAELTGPPLVLTLDAKGKPDAFWIFQMTGAFTTPPNSSVLLINGAQAGNVFWQVGGSATLGQGTTFAGNLLAHDNITLNAGASVSGRLLALNGAVRLNANNVSLCCDPINLSPAVLPDGTVCTPYSQTITASGGTAPYVFTVTSGALPPELGPLTPTGVLSGTPTKPGPFTFTVTATDSHGCTGSREYRIVIGCPAPPPIFPPVIHDPMACIFYKETFPASDGCGPYQYTFTGLPEGLTPSPLESGEISGIANTPGDYPITVTARNTVTGCLVSRTYTLHVICNVTIMPPTLPDATACAPYSQTLSGSCGTAKYTFSVPANTLPNGLTLSPKGLLCGTPTTPGGYTFTVTAIDAKLCTATRTYTLKVACNVAISPATLPDGTVGVPYSQAISGSCGPAPYTCTVTGPLPPGLTPTGCLIISGTPTTSGCYPFTVTVTDANGCSSTIIYRICIKNCPIIVLPPVLPDGSICAPYDQLITASCAIAPYTCSLSSGMLPAGLTLSNCRISGTPEAVGNSKFTVRVTDAGLNTADRPYTLLVTGGITLSPATLPSATLSVPYDETVTASGGTTPYTFTVSSGTLPTGTTLNMATGQISGTPTVIGTFNFCITVTDANMPPCMATQCYTITVAVGGATLSGWGMLILSILLVGAGFALIRKGD